MKVTNLLPPLKEKNFWFWKEWKKIRRWRKQRLTRGFADVDYWNLGNFVCSILTHGLRQLANNLHTYPTQFTAEEWKTYLLDTADMIEYAMDDSVYDKENPFPEYSEEWKNQNKILKNQKQDCLSIAFERLVPYMEDLWD